jgi:hypothetical protein
MWASWFFGKVRAYPKTHFSPIPLFYGAVNTSLKALLKPSGRFDTLVEIKNRVEQSVRLRLDRIFVILSWFELFLKIVYNAHYVGYGFAAFWESFNGSRFDLNLLQSRNHCRNFFYYMSLKRLSGLRKINNQKTVFTLFFKKTSSKKLLINIESYILTFSGSKITVLDELSPLYEELVNRKS